MSDCTPTSSDGSCVVKKPKIMSTPTSSVVDNNTEASELSRFGSSGILYPFTALPMVRKLHRINEGWWDPAVKAYMDMYHGDVFIERSTGFGWKLFVEPPADIDFCEPGFDVHIRDDLQTDMGLDATKRESIRITAVDFLHNVGWASGLSLAVREKIPSVFKNVLLRFDGLAGSKLCEGDVYGPGWFRVHWVDVDVTNIPEDEIPSVDLLLLFGHINRRGWPYDELKTIKKMMEYLPVGLACNRHRR